ncbi:hypothetical protein [Amphritea sp.]|uniref:hypothetical protein n=1 Tax=Amphritea sp. TaxID=1872502 RepID=UPI0025C26B54|nr:hypothetical protein [Amphritea sp.]
MRLDRRVWPPLAEPPATLRSLLSWALAPVLLISILPEKSIKGLAQSTLNTVIPSLIRELFCDKLILNDVAVAALIVFKQMMGELMEKLSIGSVAMKKLLCQLVIGGC